MKNQIKTSTEWLGKIRYSYEEIDSTNAEAMRLAKDGAPHGTVVAADLQTAGRGRRGRDWNSPKGAGLYVTLLLRPKEDPEHVPALTLVAAMAVSAAIRAATGCDPGIKWPNDIILSGRKVCGILAEMHLNGSQVEAVVVGIGINLTGEAYPKELSDRAISLEEACALRQQERAMAWDRDSLLEGILREFERYYGLYEQSGDVSLFREEYERLLVNFGRQVRLIDRNGEQEAVALGINDRGELMVERNGHRETVNAGEVSVRGLYGYV